MCVYEMKTFIILFVCVIIHNSANANLVPFITPCHAEDQACLRASAQETVPILAAGVPSLGVGKMDPMHLKRVRTLQAGLDMDFRNTIVKGLRNCEVLTLRRRSKYTDLDLKCSVVLVGDYTLGGKLLVFPIEGNGRYKIKIKDIVVKIVFEVTENKVGGDAYWKITDWKHTAQVLTNVEYQFKNLFNGNKRLSDTVQEFANRNWQDIFHEVAPPIVTAVVSQVVDEISNLFERVPVRQMALDTDEW